MKSLNPNLYPKGGFHFVNIDGARIFGDSWRGVEARVKKYRERAGQTIGDVWGELVAQVCTREPMVCVEENTAYSQEVSRASLKGRVLTWLAQLQAKLHREPVQFVSDAERNGRVNTCAGCPLNTALPEGCASCRAALKEARQAIIGGRAVDNRTNACSVLGEDIPTSTWIESVREDNGALPGHCWRKRQL